MLRTTLAALTLAGFSCASLAQGTWPTDPWTDFRSIRSVIGEITQPGRAVGFSGTNIYASGYDANGNGAIGLYVFGDRRLELADIIHDPSDSPTRGFGMRFLSSFNRVYAADPGYFSTYHPRHGLEPAQPEGPGRVEIFARSTQNSPMRYIHALENPTGDQRSGFGFALAAGQFLIVGAPFTDVLGVENAGAVFVYEWNGDFFDVEYDLIATLTPPVLTPNGYFGYAVAAAGDDVIVGWPGQDYAEGRVVIYTEESFEQWTLDRVIAPEDINHAEDLEPRWFGSALAVPANDEHILAIAAPNTEQDSVGRRSTVFILERDRFDDTPFSLSATILQPYTLGGQRFGESLSFASWNSSRILAIGSSNREIGPGIVNVYTNTRPSNDWTRDAALRDINGGGVATAIHSTFQRVVASGNLGSFSLLYSRDALCFPDLRADINNDGATDFVDLNIILAQFGQQGEGLLADLNNDNVVDSIDLNIVLALFAAPCLPPS